MEHLEGLYEEEKWTPFGETNTESGEASAALKEPALGTNYATSESECTPTTGPKRTQKPDTKAKQAKASEKPSGVAQVPAKKKQQVPRKQNQMVLSIVVLCNYFDFNKNL